MTPRILTTYHKDVDQAKVDALVDTMGSRLIAAVEAHRRLRNFGEARLMGGDIELYCCDKICALEQGGEKFADPESWDFLIMGMPSDSDIAKAAHAKMNANGDSVIIIPVGNKT